MPPASPDPSLTHLGHLLGPQGLAGGIKLFVLGRPEQLLNLKRVYLEGRGWLKLLRSELLLPAVVLYLNGVQTREAAEALRGLKVYAADDELPALPEGEYYYHQLRGLPVYDQHEQLRGEVSEVLDGGHQDLLEVRHEHGTALLPLQAPYILIESGPEGPERILLTADAPEGLLDIEEA